LGKLDPGKWYTKIYIDEAAELATVFTTSLVWIRHMERELQLKPEYELPTLKPCQFCEYEEYLDIEYFGEKRPIKVYTFPKDWIKKPRELKNRGWPKKHWDPNEVEENPF
jgi:hypothetical protein